MTPYYEIWPSPTKCSTKCPRETGSLVEEVSYRESDEERREGKITRVSQTIPSSFPLRSLPYLAAEPTF